MAVATRPSTLLPPRERNWNASSSTSTCQKLGLPPPHIVPKEPKDHGYVDMNRVGDPLVEKKRPKWHEYGGYYRPVRPGIPWMPSPEITSPLPLPYEIHLPAEEDSSSVNHRDGTLNAQSVLTIEARGQTNYYRSHGRERQHREVPASLASSRSSSSGHYSSSSESISSDDYSSFSSDAFRDGRVPLRDDRSDTVDFVESVLDVIEDGLCRNVFDGSPLQLVEDRTASLSSQVGRCDGWTHAFRSAQKKIVSRLGATKRKNAIESGGSLYPGNVTEGMSAPCRSPPASVSGYDPVQSRLPGAVAHLPNPQSTASERVGFDFEALRDQDPVGESLPPGSTHPALIEYTSIPVPRGRAFDLVSLPHESFMEVAAEDRPSSVRGIYSSDELQGDGLVPNEERDSDYMVEGNLLGLLPGERVSVAEISQPRDGLTNASLLLQPPSSAHEIMEMSRIQPCPSTDLPRLDDAPLDRFPGAMVGEPLTWNTAPISPPGLLEAPLGQGPQGMQPPLWYFRPPSPLQTENHTDPLRQLTLTAKEIRDVDCFQPLTQTQEEREDNSNIAAGLHSGLHPADYGCSESQVGPLWDSTGDVNTHHRGIRPYSKALEPLSEPPWDLLHGQCYVTAEICAEPQRHVFRLDVHSIPTTGPSTPQVEYDQMKTCMEPMKGEPTEARNTGRGKFAAKFDVKRDPDEVLRRSRKEGLPGTDDWRRYVIARPNAYGPLPLREYFSFTQAMFQLEHYPAHHVRTITMANWYYQVEEIHLSHVDHNLHGTNGEASANLAPAAGPSSGPLLRADSDSERPAPEASRASNLASFLNTGWPTVEGLQKEDNHGLTRQRRAVYEVPDDINNTALLMWYPVNLRDGQGLIFEVVTEETLSNAQGETTSWEAWTDPMLEPLPDAKMLGIKKDHKYGLSTDLVESLDTLESFSFDIPLEERAPALRTVGLPLENPLPSPQPVETIRLRRELQYREMPPANLPLPKVVCPHEWKAFGYWARPVIENVDMYNTPSPWLGSCNLDPENPRDPYAPIKSVEATFWVDTDATPEEVLFHLKDHPDDKPLPERWQVGVVHACLPPKPPRWKTPDPSVPDPGPLEVQLNPYLEHLVHGAQRMNWDVRYDSALACLGFDEYKGFIPLWPQDLAQPASFPFVKQMHINALADDHLPWHVVVENPEGVKVRDVIFAIFRTFQRFIENEEFSEFPEMIKRECVRRKELRCQLGGGWGSNHLQSGNHDNRIRRLDWFGSKTTFKGLAPGSDGNGWTLYLGEQEF